MIREKIIHGIDVMPINDRISLASDKAKKINIASLYAPTADSTEDEKD